MRPVPPDLPDPYEIDATPRPRSWWDDPRLSLDSLTPGQRYTAVTSLALGVGLMFFGLGGGKVDDRLVIPPLDRPAAIAEAGLTTSQPPPADQQTSAALTGFETSADAPPQPSPSFDTAPTPTQPPDTTPPPTTAPPTTTTTQPPGLLPGLPPVTLPSS